MTIPREIEGPFVILDNSLHQQNGPLMSAEEADILEMFEQIDDLWGGDEASFCPSSDGSSSQESDEIDGNDSVDEHFMLDIDFPRPARARTERRPTRSRLLQLQREVAEERRRFGLLVDINEENTNDDDSVVLHTRRGVRRHNQRRREEVADGEEQTLLGSFCSTRSEKSTRVPTKV